MAVKILEKTLGTRSEAKSYRRCVFMTPKQNYLIKFFLVSHKEEMRRGIKIFTAKHDLHDNGEQIYFLFYFVAFLIKKK